MEEKRPTYLIEFIRVGGQVKVVACDPETGLEGVVIVPAHATQKEMTTLAIRKLEYLIEKNKTL